MYSMFGVARAYSAVRRWSCLCVLYVWSCQAYSRSELVVRTLCLELPIVLCGVTLHFYFRSVRVYSRWSYPAHAVRVYSRKRACGFPVRTLCLELPGTPRPLGQPGVLYVWSCLADLGPRGVTLDGLSRSRAPLLASWSVSHPAAGPGLSLAGE